MVYGYFAILEKPVVILWLSGYVPLTLWFPRQETSTIDSKEGNTH